MTSAVILYARLENNEESKMSNEKLNNRLGFFDYLGRNDYVQAALTLYNFLKQERLEAIPGAESLVKTEKELEEFIARII